MTVRSFDPLLEVRLVKAIKRKEIVKGLPVILDRYGNLDGFDLTEWLTEGCRLHLNKSVRAPAGAWSLTLADKPHSTLFETIAAMTEPMDLIEIRMAHKPLEYHYIKNSEDDGLPVVMRGFVSTIVRNETMVGGRPHRTFTLAGQDLSKVLSIIMIYYHNNSIVGENIISELRFFQKYLDGSAPKIVPAVDFLLDVLAKVVNPYMKKITALADGESIGAKVANELLYVKSELTPEGSVSPHLASSFQDVSLYSFLCTILDVGPFNELFVEDRDDGPYIVYRPVPAMAVGDTTKYIQKGAWAKSIIIDAEDVEAISVTRSDAGVANFFWVENHRWAMYQNRDMRELAMTAKAPYIYFTDFNSDMNYYGVRKMEVPSNLGGPKLSNSDSALDPRIATDTDILAEWLDERRGVLGYMNKDNVVFESGTIRVRGNEKIKAGMYLFVVRQDTIAMYYVTSITHDFQPFHGFFTTCRVERGTGFIDRAQLEGTPYFDELTVRGLTDDA